VLTKVFVLVTLWIQDERIAWIPGPAFALKKLRRAGKPEMTYVHTHFLMIFDKNMFFDKIKRFNDKEYLYVYAK
jgi:hypothetical protein